MDCLLFLEFYLLCHRQRTIQFLVLIQCTTICKTHMHSLLLVSLFVLPHTVNKNYLNSRLCTRVSSVQLQDNPSCVLTLLVYCDKMSAWANKQPLSDHLYGPVLTVHSHQQKRDADQMWDARTPCVWATSCSQCYSLLNLNVTPLVNWLQRWRPSLYQRHW